MRACRAQPLGVTLPDQAAFGTAGQIAAAIAEPALPLARLSFEGARDERIISGSNRYKYFRRPIIPFMNAQPPEVLFAPVGPEVGAHKGELVAVPDPEPATKEAGCQSMYRESAAQTSPFAPEHVVREGDDPEVLTLTDLRYGQGLPAGLNEVRMIERLREKREFESSLPPMTDEVSLALRRKMMGEQELRDWNVREEQIFEVRASAELV